MAGIIISGLPHGLVEQAIKRSNQFLGDGEVLRGCPLGSSPDAMASEIVDASMQLFKYDDSARYGAPPLVNLFFDLGATGMRDSVQKLTFLYTVVCSELSFADLEYRGRRFGPKTVDRVVSICRRELGAARRGLRSLAKEIQEKDSSTPLLLPVRNFSSKLLRGRLTQVLLDVHVSAEPDVTVSQTAKDLSQAFSARNENKQWVYRDERGLDFRAPSKSGPRHGKPNAQPPHTDLCYLSGHLRLGVPFHCRFHYDCNKGGSISGQFASCHEAAEIVRPQSHLNIAPSDNIRK